jgi:hypothetical protein
MSKVEKLPKKPTNHLNQIYCDTITLEKLRREFEVIAEEEDDSISLPS